MMKNEQKTATKKQRLSIYLQCIADLAFRMADYPEEYLNYDMPYPEEDARFLYSLDKDELDLNIAKVKELLEIE